MCGCGGKCSGNGGNGTTATVIDPTMSTGNIAPAIRQVTASAPAQSVVAYTRRAPLAALFIAALVGYAVASR